GTSYGIYRGRLEALAHIKPFIRGNNCEYVLLSDTDVIANIDYRPIVDFHKESGADITEVYGKGTFSTEQCATKTVLSVNGNNEICDVLVRPEMSGEFNVSLNMFVVGKQFLLDLITDAESRNLYSFEIDILQHKLHDLKVMGYRFDAPFFQIDGISTYIKSNMALVSKELRDIIFNSDAPIYTKVRDDAPAKYGIGAEVKNSLIADGCVIEGTVENCVLFRGVKVGKGAVIKNSILMQDTVVGAKAEISNVITDKNVVISDYRALSGTESYPVYVNKNATV
ncbi:MAG: glucose-1-phosphate adenylyltransferase subunit GlgD, partial [Ruminiclostridium sp.]|nr:glucose-1-phosphate adenylyltransferase subunit GlgD [Ruminiclostridium sp.]